MSDGTLGVGCWMLVVGLVKFRCPDCAGMFDVPAAQVSSNGDADFGSMDGPLFFCQTPACGLVRGLRFLGWPKWDVSDVTS